MVFHGFYHDRVLLARVRDLHAPGAPDRRMRHVAITANLIGRIDDNHALVKAVRQNASDFAQAGGLADTGRTKQQQALASLDLIPDLIDGAKDSAPDPQGEPDDMAFAIPDSGDAVQGAFDA